MMARRTQRSARRGGGGRRWGRLLALGAGLCVVLAIVFVFGMLAWARHYLHSDGFRALAGERISEFLRAEGQFEPFQWTNTSAYTERFSAMGYPEASFSELEVRGLRVDVNLGAVREGVWEITRIEGTSLEAVVSDDRLPARPAGRGAEAGGGGGSGFFTGLLPDELVVREVEIGQANVRVESERGISSLEGARVHLRPEPAGSAELTVVGGTVELAGLEPTIELARADARLTNDRVFLTGINATFYDGAFLQCSGEVARGGEGTVIDLDVEFRGLEGEKVLPPDWAKRVTGSFLGEVSVFRADEAGAETVAEGTVELVGGVVEGLPVLEHIARYTRVDNFRRLNLTTARTGFSRSGDALVLRDLVLESSGLLKVVGGLTVSEEKSIAGTFDVGVTPGTLRWLPGAETKVFNRSEGGYLWTSVQVGGTVDNPHENLSARLLGGVIEEVVELLPAAAQDTVRDTLEGTVRGARDAADSAGELIEQGKSLLKGLFGN